MTFTEVASIVEQLPAVPDDRNPPDGRRRGHFRAGWEDFTIRGKVYREKTLQLLRWHNLGYRFGKLVGWRDAPEIDEVYGHLARMYEGTRRDGLAALPGELADDVPLFEGATCRVMVNSYERNREAVLQCKNAHGAACVICGFDFEAAYGKEFAGFIHVHHLRPLSEAGGAHAVDPINDLRPVCPNCHAVIHHGGRLRSINQVRLLFQQRPTTTDKPPVARSPSCQ